ncbi:cytochrome c oxidase subunit 3 [Propionivibrio sp.]|uniref:cytochrome c oxidase subunit 3 n=1 Tax=Propionivibrio sp. TaxID=2212460 RepID=UPI002607C78D|nr:cytochrome c oxidase subunit 3 [Propionivibrio sp.]
MQAHNNAYYVPPPSIWPIVGSVALLTLAVGFALVLNKVAVGSLVMALGAGILLIMLFGWFGAVIKESLAGKYARQVDTSFRWGMVWFIFSEVMFFAGFFGALFYARNLALPGLADAQSLWPGFSAAWPTTGPGLKTVITPVNAWGIPALNTLILLSSGATLTWAHWGLQKDRQRQLKLGLALTIALGILFIGLQIHEYGEAAFTIRDGIYGATFYMLTGFHGFHVMMGSVMLIVILLRSLAGHFTPGRHFAFEAVAWYWHFVDVIWLLLFIFVYCL